MPNHYQTVALCARDWNALEAKGLEDFDLSPLNGADLCEIVRPLPDDLKNIVSTNQPSRYRHKMTGEYHHGVNGPGPASQLEWERVPVPEDELAALRARHGAATWYEWCPKNWGTKWGTYDLTVRELGGDGAPVLIEFLTAWGPPNDEMMRLIDQYLCETYCLRSITWVGHDPACGETEVIELRGTP